MTSYASMPTRAAERTAASITQRTRDALWPRKRFKPPGISGVRETASQSVQLTISTQAEMPWKRSARQHSIRSARRVRLEQGMRLRTADERRTADYCELRTKLRTAD